MVCSFCICIYVYLYNYCICKYVHYSLNVIVLCQFIINNINNNISNLSTLRTSNQIDMILD